MAVIRGSTQGASTTLPYLTSGTHLRGGLSVVEKKYSEEDSSPFPLCN